MRGIRWIRIARSPDRDRCARNVSEGVEACAERLPRVNFDRESVCCGSCEALGLSEWVGGERHASGCDTGDGLSSRCSGRDGLGLHHLEDVS